MPRSLLLRNLLLRNSAGAQRRARTGPGHPHRPQRSSLLRKLLLRKWPRAKHDWATCGVAENANRDKITEWETSQDHRHVLSLLSMLSSSFFGLPVWLTVAWIACLFYFPFDHLWLEVSGSWRASCCTTNRCRETHPGEIRAIWEIWAPRNPLLRDSIHRVPLLTDQRKLPLRNLQLRNLPRNATPPATHSATQKSRRKKQEHIEKLPWVFIPFAYLGSLSCTPMSNILLRKPLPRDEQPRNQ